MVKNGYAQKNSPTIRAAMRVVNDCTYQIRKRFGIKEFFVLEDGEGKVVYSGKRYDFMQNRMGRGEDGESYRSYAISVQPKFIVIETTNWENVRYEDEVDTKETSSTIDTFPNSGQSNLEKILRELNPQIKLDTKGIKWKN
ncbi:MAG: hypothetical protein WCI72_01340 [archaeon]